MNLLKIKLIGAALLLASTTAFAEPTYFEVSGISDASSLVLRAWPSASSKPINNIPHNAVKIETTGKHIFKEGKKWLQIMYQNNVGWAEADYLTAMQSATQAELTETINKASAFNYFPQAVDNSPQASPEAIRWTPEEDTIYHDPTSQQLAGENPIERVDVTHTLAVVNNNVENVDLRGETLTVNRYESIQASMSVQYQP